MDDYQIITTVPHGCAQVLRAFAKLMGMSEEEAARYMLQRATVDIISSPGLANLLPRKGRTR